MLIAIVFRRIFVLRWMVLLPPWCRVIAGVEEFEQVAQAFFVLRVEFYVAISRREGQVREVPSEEGAVDEEVFGAREEANPS